VRRNCLTVLSLFTGAGGLDLGLEAAGFETSLCVEIDADSRRTLELNRPRWRQSEPGDVHSLTPSEVLKQAGLKPRQLVLLAGGPPCQPFSQSGYWSKGDTDRLKDPRAKTLDAYLNLVGTALPEVLLLENVKGFAFEGKDEGLKLLRKQLSKINAEHSTAYSAQVLTINAADYGVPQQRERVFILASRDGRKLELPEPTHGPKPAAEPYLTAWDAIGDLDTDTWPEELNPAGQWAGLLPSIPEGANYLWHTPRNEENGGEPLFGWRTRFWSFLLKLAKSQPSWTLQAAPGPATGPFHWRSRLLSIKEMARLQTFPEKYIFSGSRRAAQRQIGNAVPSAIGELLGLEIRRQLFGHKVRRRLKLIPIRRDGPPGPESISAVPLNYQRFRADHRDHPGSGLGPSAILRGRPNAIEELAS